MKTLFTVLQNPDFSHIILYERSKHRCLPLFRFLALQPMEKPSKTQKKFSGFPLLLQTFFDLFNSFILPVSALASHCFFYMILLHCFQIETYSDDIQYAQLHFLCVSNNFSFCVCCDMMKFDQLWLILHVLFISRLVQKCCFWLCDFPLPNCHLLQHSSMEADQICCCVLFS